MPNAMTARRIPAYRFIDITSLSKLYGETSETYPEEEFKWS
jgi:hypothetical protein